MGKVKVLIAEDSPSIRKMVAMGLRTVGFEIIEAEDGLQAIGRIINLKPDVLLLDLNMPKLSGWEVCDKIRSLPDFKALPIIINSTQNQLGDIKLAQRYAVSAYLVKPFSLDKLVQKIKEVLAAPPPINKNPQETQPVSEPAKPVKPEYPTYPLEVQGEVAVISLCGELNQPQMINDSISKAFKEHSKKLLIDLTSVNKIRAQSIIAISRAERLAKSLWGTVKVVMNNPEIIKDFEVAKELQFLDYYASIEEAIASF